MKVFFFKRKNFSGSLLNIALPSWTVCTQNMSKTYFGCKSTKTYEKAQSAENNKKNNTQEL